MTDVFLSNVWKSVGMTVVFLSNAWKNVGMTKWAPLKCAVVALLLTLSERTTLIYPFVITLINAIFGI